MPEKQRKTLKERLLHEGVKDRYFMMNSENNKKVYTVTGMEGGDLEIKYRNNKKTKIKAISHLDDLEVVVNELVPGSFYEIASNSKNEIAHFTENGHLIDSKGNTLDKNKTKDLLLIEDVRGYMNALREDSKKNEECVKFMERYFFRNKFEKLHDEDIILDDDLTDADTALTGLDLGDTGYELAVPDLDDPDDSFAGLLDLSLQADDTSLGGILDEIYIAEDDNKTDIEDDDPTPVYLSPERRKGKKKRGFFQKSFFSNHFL